jgi:hypothetical protein
VKSNDFGGATFRYINPENNTVMVSYLANNERVGIRATDSGRSNRVNLSNVIVRDNSMNNERIIGCDGNKVVCEPNNTNVGTK